jgi:hypothetical protein
MSITRRLATVQHKKGVTQMAEIFALAMYIYFPLDPDLNHFQFQRDWVFSTAEQCEQLRTRLREAPPTKGGGSGLKYVCLHKTVQTWQPVE